MQWRSKMFYSKFPFRFVCQSFISAMCRTCQPHHSANDSFIIKTFAKCSQCHKFLCRQMFFFFATKSSKETGEGKSKKKWNDIGNSKNGEPRPKAVVLLPPLLQTEKKNKCILLSMCAIDIQGIPRTEQQQQEHCSIHLASRLHFPTLTVSRWLLHQLENAKCEWAFLIDVWTTEWKTP